MAIFDTANAARIGRDVPQPPKEMTLTERLANAARNMDNQADRFEFVLARINGAPTRAQEAQKEAGTPALTDIVAHMESIAQRLNSLAEGVERIA